MPSILDSISSLRNSGPPTLNWLFLVENIVIVILVIFYFFFFNRVTALVVSFILRQFFWKSNNAYFDIDALQFSLIGGRIDFSGLRYISRNQSLRVLHGSVTWRYWIWRARSEEDKLSEAQIPCRLNVTMEGAEWFLYNRTPSYDAILEHLGLVDPLSSTAAPKHSENINQLNQTPKEKDASDKSYAIGEEGEESQHVEKNSTDWFRETLPVEIKCSTGSIIMGNSSTQSIVIAGFESANGSFTAVKSRSRFDLYKQVYKINFIQPKVVYRTNPDYEGPLAKHGEEVLERIKTIPGFDLKDFLSNPASHLTISNFADLMKRIPNIKTQPIDPDLKSSLPFSPSEWAGLPRYQNETDLLDSKQSLPHRVDYAKVMTLLTSPELEMTYYVDEVGKVPKVAKVVTGFKGLETFDIGNGDLSPEWGVDLVIKGGVITYGPWADRQRAELQQVFTPATFYNSKETPMLKPGDLRVHTTLKVFVEFSEGATLRIPTRESSKDWKYDNLDETDTINNSNETTIRPYGWLDLSFGSNSTLSYVMPTIATSSGFDTLFEFHLDEMTVASSVNYATFMKAETCRIHCSLPAPLKWDDLRTWTINVTMAKPEISLLRDHITLFADVSKDFVSGPSGEFLQFVPYIYVFNLNLSELTLKLYVNDHNIINNATADEDNSLLICRAPRLISSVIIPSDLYRMNCSTINFSSTATNLALSMSLPDWNTHNAFLTDNSRNIASTPELSVEGSYRFYASSHPDHVERLKIAVECRDVVFKTMGWMIRHLFNLRDNYFGSFTHFVTLEEYRHRHERNLQGDPLELKYRPGATDVFEVAVTLKLTNGLQILPQELFDCQSAVVLVLPQLQVDLRNHDFFMELALNIDPFRIIQTSDCATLMKQDFSSLLAEADSIRVQGLEVTANRLFGPQPRTSTYICIWSIYLGSIIGSIPPSFIQSISRITTALGTNFVDQDNSLPADFTVALEPDATFVTVDLDSIDIAIRGQGTAIQIALEDGVKIRFDDLATKPFLQHISVEIPTLCLRFLAPLFGRAAPWMEVASIEADFSIVIGLSESGWEQKSRTQLEYISIQDEMTKRCPFIYGGGESTSSHIGSLFLPGLAAPLNSNHAGFDFTSRDRNSQYDSSSGESTDMDESDTSSDYTSDGSESSEDNYEAIYSRLPGRRAEEGNRFSAYGAVLRLCERAPEGSFLDKPTFRRLPAAFTSSSDSNAIPSLPSNSERLDNFRATMGKASHSRISIDITSRKAIRVVITPVSVQVCTDVLDNMPLDLNLEHCLDDLFTTYVDSQKPLNKSRFSTFQLTSSIPSIEIDSIQDVLRPEEIILIRRNDSLPQDNRSTVLCTVRITLADVKLSLEVTEDNQSSNDNLPLSEILLGRRISASARKTRLEVFHPEQTPIHTSMTPRTRHNLPTTTQRQRPTALDLEIGLCEAILDFSATKAKLLLNGGEARLEFVDEAAELVIGSLWSWRVLQNFAGPLVKRNLKSLEFSRQLVYSIVEASERLNITSFPTFLNRVSYLVGTSNNLRTDDGWKTLCQLRHTLRLAETSITEAMNKEKIWSSTSELYIEIVDILSRWKSWEIDSEDLSQSDFLSSLFGQFLPQSQSNNPVVIAPSNLDWDKPIELEWIAGRFEASLSDGQRSENWLAIGPISAFVASSGRGINQDILQVSGKITIEVIDANVDRDLLLLVRHIIKVRNTFERKIQLFRESLVNLVPETTIQVNSNIQSTSFFSNIPRMVISASFGIKESEARALANNLEAISILQDVSASITILFEPKISRNSRPMSHQVHANTSFTIGNTSLIARDITTSQEPLLSAELEQISLIGNAVGSHSWNGLAANEVPSLRFIFASQAIHTKIPRDAIKVYEYFENWRTETLPTYDSLLTDLRQGLDEIQSVTIENNSSEPTFIQLLSEKANISTQLCIPLITFEIQAIKTLAMIYSIKNVSIYANTEDGAKGGSALGEIDAGLMIESQRIQFIPMSSNDGLDYSIDSDLETSFDLPIIRLKAHLDGLPCHQINFLLSVDPFSIKLTSSILDNILTAQNRFGNDVDELLAVIRSKRSKLVEGKILPVKKEVICTKLIWDVKIAFQGLRIGIESPASIQWIEASLLEGYASSVEANSSLSLHWQASVQNLSISLSQRAAKSLNPLATSDRGPRLAFFSLDLTIGNEVIRLPELPNELIIEDDQTPHLHLRLTRVHAVLQPVAVDALADLIDHFQDELELRRSSQKEEVDAIKDRVFQTFDMVDNQADVEQSISWLASCIISVEAQNFGIAIPLSDAGIPTSNRPQSHPAFFVSLPSLHFSTRKGQAGYAKITALTFQFVNNFDQSKGKDFNANVHDSLNRVVFPELTTTIRSLPSGKIIAHSAVSGIEIDLESNAIGFIFSLIDVYQLSNERFAKYATLSTDPIATTQLSSSSSSGGFAISATFEFESGIISMHSKKSSWNRSSDANSSPRLSRPTNHKSGRSLSDFSNFRTSSIKPISSELAGHVDIFRLPAMSAWIDYREGNSILESSELQSNIIIHSSNNKIFPSLIPFISDVASLLKARALKSPTSPPTNATTQVSTSSKSTNRLKIGISLKLDQSRLEISCEPAAKVTATLTWESGGLILNTSPDIKGIDASLSVDGISLTLAHDFSPEKCLSTEVKGIASTISFQASEEGIGSLSIVVDIPDISANMNFRHLQDFHCIKAIWFDRMDLGPINPKVVVPEDIVELEGVSTSPDFALTTLLLVRLQKVEIVCDLGQAIGRSTFIANSVNTRLRWIPNESKHLSIAVGGIEIIGKGRASGRVSLEGFLFETRLRNGSDSELHYSDLLHIKIGLGEIDASIEYDFHKILLINSDPIAIAVNDDWSRVTTKAAELELAFEVKMGNFRIIATVATIPNLVSLSRKIEALLEEKAAQADSTIALAGLPPRPSVSLKSINAVSAVASKLTSDKSRSEEFPIRILSDLDIEAEGINIAIFADHFNDGEVFRMDAGEIKSRLLRGINAEKTIHRDLSLHLGYFSIRKVQYKKLTSVDEARYTVQEWYNLFRSSNEKNIFKVPTTNSRMESDQVEGSYKLEHDFSMNFIGQVDIAFNYALLRNLQSLATSYQLLMDEVANSENIQSFKIETTILPPSTPEIQSLLQPESNSIVSDRKVLEYSARSLNIEQPKLIALGEATPSLEWVGLQSTSFPQYVHSAVTLTLEELLLVLNSTYSVQLARQKLKKKKLHT